MAHNRAADVDSVTEDELRGLAEWVRSEDPTEISDEDAQAIARALLAGFPHSVALPLYSQLRAQREKRRRVGRLGGLAKRETSRATSEKTRRILDAWRIRRMADPEAGVNATAREIAEQLGENYNTVKGVIQAAKRRRADRLKLGTRSS
jgi:hypothetical protein